MFWVNVKAFWYRICFRRNAWWLGLFWLAACHTPSETTYIPPDNPPFARLLPEATGLTTRHEPLDFDTLALPEKIDSSAVKIIHQQISEISSAGGIALGDWNKDNLPDIVLIHGDGRKRYFINIKNFRFEGRTDSLQNADFQFNKNKEIIVDFDNDGFPERFVLGKSPATLARRKGHLSTGNNQLFDGATGLEIAHFSGVAHTEYSQQATTADLDNDGFQDLLVASGTGTDFNDLDFVKTLYDTTTYQKSSTKNLGSLLALAPKIALPNAVFLGGTNNQARSLGLGKPTQSIGIIAADFDDDGDTDIISLAFGGIPEIFRNDTKNENNFLKIKVLSNKKGAYPTTQLWVKGIAQLVEPSVGFTQVGLGRATHADSIIARWPDGFTLRLKNITAGQRLELKPETAQKEGIPTPVVRTVATPKISELEGITPRFKGEVFASADLNDDGQADFFFPNRKNQFWFQKEDGNLIPQKNTISIPQQKITTATFGDLNKDALPDLILATIGTASPDSGGVWICFNSGKNQFEVPEKPIFHGKFDVIALADLEADGDLDIFAGSGNDDSDAKNYLFKNETGGLREDTPEVLKKLGKVQSAAWQDLDANGLPDLVTVGYWTSPTIFYNQNGRFTYAYAEPISNLEGLWEVATIFDFNKDNKPDIILGNRGLNTPLRASEKYPLVMLVNDFDRDGKTDKLLTITGADDQLYSIDNLATWKAALPKWKPPHSNATFSKLAITALLARDQRRGTIEKKAVELRSGWLENLGNGRFVFRAFSERLQWLHTKEIWVNQGAVWLSDGKNALK